MTLIEEIRRAFSPEGRQPRVSIYAEDIEALIGDGEDVRFVTLTGDSMDELVGQLQEDPQLLAARKIVVEYIVSADFEFPISNLVPFWDLFASLPTNPEIVWGYSRADKQSRNIKLNIVFT